MPAPINAPLAPLLRPATRLPINAPAILPSMVDSFPVCFALIKRRAANGFPPFRGRRIGAFRQVLVGETSQHPALLAALTDVFRSFSGLARTLN
jgi:hypothetical protein